MSPRDRETDEAIERLLVALFVVIIIALSTGVFGD